jgi:hypothetical protein
MRERIAQENKAQRKHCDPAGAHDGGLLVRRIMASNT